MFKKKALAAALSAGLAWGTADAYVLGPPGEALLVPFAVYTQVIPIIPFIPLGLNTVVLIDTPGTLGQDVVPNLFTAPHVSQAGGPDFTQVCKKGQQNPSTGEITLVEHPCDRVHWYFFDYQSRHLLDGIEFVTPDDKLVFDWRSKATESGKALDGEIGYLVFTTEAGANGKAANFAMAGDAFLTLGIGHTPIPVLPMSDGDDAVEPGPSPANNCISGGDDIPRCSPIISGTRLSNGDGADRVLVDLELFPRKFLLNLDQPELELKFALNALVVWLDHNYGTDNIVPEYNGITVEAFDEDENACSDTIPLPNELNVALVFPDITLNDNTLPFPPPEVTEQLFQGTPLSLINLCTHNAEVGRGRFGFVRYNLPEGEDVAGRGGATSAGVFFNIVFAAHQQFGIGLSTQLGHDVGKKEGR
ncbi:MAG: hypothetical protein D6819_07725 [Gammaproteobacteria bacterium]|nr:MAG: hypothetical protein D6819_07725 [Gammaproteobacteria bacterium]